MSPCGTYNKFCCGQDKASRGCCDDGNANLTAQIPASEPMLTEIAYPSSCSALTGIPSATMMVTVTPSAFCPSSSKTERNALIGLGAGFGVVALLAAGLAIFWRKGMTKKTRALRKEKTALEEENRKLKQRLPGPIRREMENAKIHSSVATSESHSS